MHVPQQGSLLVIGAADRAGDGPDDPDDPDEPDDPEDAGEEPEERGADMGEGDDEEGEALPSIAQHEL